MALTFVLGNAGSGKSTFLRNFILEEAEKHPEKKYLVLVPEQFTMSTQKEYVQASPRKCIMNIDVLSFERLAYRVFDELGMSDLTVLEDTGKMLVLRQIVQQHRGELTTLKNKVEKPGYLDQVKSLLTEFMQYHITPTQIEEMLKEMPKSILYYKLQDLLVLYKGMEEYLQGNYVTAEKLLILLADVAERSKMLKDAVVCFDGYTGFTPVQNLFMKKLLPLAQDVYVTVLLDVRENARVCSGSHELFYISKKYIRQITKLAEETHTPVKPDIIMDVPENRRFVNAKGLAALEKNIFHPRKEIFAEEQENVEIIRCMNPKKELKLVAEEISQLVKQGYRYEDCAIVTGDLKTYGRQIKTIFKQAGIPLFIDEKDTIIYNGFVELVKGALDLSGNNFSQEGVFRYLKSGMTDLSNEEIDELENYVRAMRIRGHEMYAAPFVRKGRTYGDAELEDLNRIRRKMMEPLEPFWKSTCAGRHPVSVYAAALYDLLEYFHVDEALKQEKQQLELRGELKRSREYDQCYGLLIHLLDKCVALLGQEEMNSEEFLEILTAGLEHTKIGTIPAGRDCVILGDIERTRLEHIKVLFFVGVNDGIIPRITSGSTCLSQKEREQLEKMKVELAASPKERSFIQQFYLYLTMTKPSERLIITYTESSCDGGEAKPAYIISQLHYMFPNLVEGRGSINRNKDGIGESGDLICPEYNFPEVVDAIRTGEVPSSTTKALYYWYRKQPQWEQKVQALVDIAVKNYEQERLSLKTAKEMYGEELFGSVSRFEDYSKCAMKHFLDFGVCLGERDEGEFQTMELGTIVHRALELYGHFLKEEKESFSTVTEEKQRLLVERAVGDAVSEQLDTALYDNPRSEYQVERIIRLVTRSVWGLSRQFRNSHFSPDFYEERFSEKLHTDSKIKIRGVIDRIDVGSKEAGDETEAPKEKIFRVVDYKTGNTQLDLKQVAGGLQLQLMVYLDAAKKILEKKDPKQTYIPDGAYYYLVKDPMIELKDSGEASDEELEQRLEKELQMSGFGRNSFEDSEIKDKKIRPAASELEEVVQYATNKMEAIGSEIMEGHIEARPYRLGDSTGCEYCNYKGICGFDEKLPGYQYREVPELSEEEALAYMKSKEA